MNATERQSSRVLRDIARQINSSVDLETTLQHLVDAACQNSLWAMSAVMSIDQSGGDALVIVRHDPNLLEKAYKNRWTLATSPALIALTRNEPVIIRDAQSASEFPGYREEAFQRGYRTVVVLPLGCDDMEGRAMVLSVQSRSVVDLSAADLAFLETIVHLGAIAVDKAHRFRAERLAAQRLTNVIEAHSALMQKVLSDGSVASAAAMVEAYISNPTVVVDLTANLVVAGRSPRPEFVSDADWKEAATTTVSRQFLRVARDIASKRRDDAPQLYLNCLGHHLNLPAKVEPLKVDGQTVGVLIVFSLGAGFSEPDQLLLESAKFALSVQLMRGHLRFQSESRTANDLFAEIVSGNWRDVDDLVARARRIGVDVGAPARLLALGLPTDATGDGKPLQDLHRSIVRLADQNGASTMVALLDSIILCRITEAERDGDAVARAFIARAIDEALWLTGREPIAVVGKVCASIEDHAQGWRECERMFRLAVRFNRTGFLAAQDFGPFPLLMSAADSDEVRAFVDATIGQVSRHDALHGTDYIKTLAVYLEHGCRGQACADAMGLHVTTLRYRLGRMQELFGIEIDTPERRFALELAIRLNETLS